MIDLFASNRVVVVAEAVLNDLLVVILEESGSVGH